MKILNKEIAAAIKKTLSAISYLKKNNHEELLLLRLGVLCKKLNLDSEDLLAMHSLGHAFVPPPIHAGGLRYHGMAPLVSKAVSEGLMAPRAIHQLECYEAGVLFAKTEGIIPAPETTHAIAAAIQEAKKAKEEGKEKVILFNFSGHGLMDLVGYDKYLSGQLSDYNLPQSEIEKNLEVLKGYPMP